MQYNINMLMTNFSCELDLKKILTNECHVYYYTQKIYVFRNFPQKHSPRRVTEGQKWQYR
jgi:hypothetical protein